MRNKDVLLPAVAAVFAAGCVATVFWGGLVHWIPILLALGVVGAIARSVNR